MFKGSMVALITPMLASGDIDWEAYASLLEWHLQAGTDALVILGTTAESPTIKDDERRELLSLAVEAAADYPTLVIAGTGSNSTEHTIHMTQQAMDLGVDAALVVVPYYNKPTQHGLYEHFKAVAATGAPIILYNIPGRTACDMLPETVAALAEIENIVAIKEASGDLSRIPALLETGLQVISGNDGDTIAMMKLGAHGVISVIANVLPALSKQMLDAALAKDWETAEQIEQFLAPLNEALYLETNPIPVKWVLAEMGRIQEGIRLPLTWLREEFHAPLRKAIVATELL